jgi:hypothetical protein
MKKLILLALFCVLLLVTRAQSHEPVKKTKAGTCFEPSHPNYEKVRNFVATYKTLEECISSGGKTPIKIG